MYVDCNDEGAMMGFLVKKRERIDLKSMSREYNNKKRKKKKKCTFISESMLSALDCPH